MIHRCVIVCLLAGPVLGGCGNYFLKEEVKSQIGKPDLVRYVSGEQFADTLYGQSKPSGLGAIDQEIWYYINRQLAVTFMDDQYISRPMGVLELLQSRAIYNALYRQANPVREATQSNDSQGNNPEEWQWHGWTKP